MEKWILKNMRIVQRVVGLIALPIMLIPALLAFDWAWPIQEPGSILSVARILIFVWAGVLAGLLIFGKLDGYFAAIARQAGLDDDPDPRR